LGALNGVLEVARGPHWKIPDAKVKRVGYAYGAVIDHYFPADKIGESSLIIGALIATASAYGPPMMVDGMKAMEAAQKAAAMRAARAAQQPPPFNPAGWMPPQPPRPQSPFNPPEPPYTGDVVDAQPFADATTPTPEMWEQAAHGLGLDSNDPMVRGAMEAASVFFAEMNNGNTTP
jgi:hypothetical protein